jgi:hypothetical protein
VSQIKLTDSQLKLVQEYCNLNNIEDVDKFISKCYTEGFNIKKYGLLGDDSGKTSIVGEKQVEIEVIREIRVEVPVEVIKEVEVIREVIKEIVKEVPVEIIKEVEVIKEIPIEKVVINEVVKEVPVEKVVTKIEYISDNTQINELLLKIQQLENRPPEIIETIKEVEIIKEVPVEKIVEVNKIVEVEKVIEVEKSNDKTLLLQETLQKLRKELSLKNTRIEDLEKINKQLESMKVSQGAVFLKGSNISETM